MTIERRRQEFAKQCKALRDRRGILFDFPRFAAGELYSDNSMAGDLIARGNIAAKNAQRTESGQIRGEFGNTGEWIQITFGDDQVGLITLTLPAELSGVYLVAADNSFLQLTFTPPVLIAFENPPADIPILRGQYVSDVIFRPMAVEYYLYAEVDKTITTELVVDLSLSQQKARALIASSRNRARNRTAGDFHLLDGDGEGVP